MLEYVILPIFDRASSQSVMRRLRFLRSAQWWSRERILEERDAALTRLATVASREVPFYRHLFDSHGIRPASIRGRDDLLRLPVVSKEMIRKAYPDSITRPTGIKWRELSSSGSTGAPMYVREDMETASLRRAAFLLALEWAGWRIGEPHIQTGVLERQGERWLKDMFLRCHYVSAHRLDDNDLDQVLERIEGQDIRHLWGYPYSLFFLAQRAIAQGWNRPMTSVVTWADTLHPNHRETIEAAFGAKVIDTYGCAEGIQVSAQCGHCAEYHIHSLDTVVEILDDQGRPVSPGETGQIVLTRLQPGAMPMIRYAVGDLGTAAVSSQCPCGRGLEMMGNIRGRDTDFVITPSGRRFLVHFFALHLEEFPEILEYQVVQESLDAILIRLVFSADIHASSRNELIGQALGRLKKGGLQEIRIDVEPVSEIPLTKGGKRRFVVSSVARDQLSVAT